MKVKNFPFDTTYRDLDYTLKQIRSFLKTHKWKKTKSVSSIEVWTNKRNTSKILLPVYSGSVDTKHLCKNAIELLIRIYS